MWVFGVGVCGEVVLFFVGVVWGYLFVELIKCFLN